MQEIATTPCQVCRTILTETYGTQFGSGLGDGRDGLLVVTCERCYDLLQVVQTATQPHSKEVLT